MPDGGELVVKTENVEIDKSYQQMMPEAHPGEFVCLSVKDSGVGMDKDVVEHIFEPFFTTKEKGKGTGLGLAVVYGIAKQHKGWVNVYSEPGNGATFKIYLPASTEIAPEEPEEKISLQGLSGNGERILLVEDEEGVRKFASAALRENGYVIYEADSASKAMEAYEREKGDFDLVFSDVVLGDRTGLQLAEDLTDRDPGIRILLCSGYSNQKSQWDIIREKKFPFIEKPYGIVDLLKLVKSLLTSKYRDTAVPGRMNSGV
jgi:CheY-like chemotaxis protein